ncbi:catalase-related domain-containing protein [uncultured Chryseobacterium sp.]|uniref:catalase-related domain-containing protein n=1 Tax=uncultured Chryseobacterium sp. TaxID=259322 RepID=UPI0025D10EC3|nr:catalase-related domain-containing protein [uncultured Chryseobacterium sp.]
MSRELFYNSQSAYEKIHLQNALIFEFSKVKIPSIRERMVGQLNFINKELAQKVAAKVGVQVTELEFPNQSLPADSNYQDLQSEEREAHTKLSAALSMDNTIKNTIKGRKIGFIIANGVNALHVHDLKTKLEGEDAVVEIIGPSMAQVTTNDGSMVTPKHSLTSIASVAFDALYIAAGEDSVKELLMADNKPHVLNFINEAYKHCKAIYFGEGSEPLYMNSNISLKKHIDPAIVSWEDETPDNKFIDAIAQHRVWYLELERNTQD